METLQMGEALARVPWVKSDCPQWQLGSVVRQDPGGGRWVGSREGNLLEVQLQILTLFSQGSRAGRSTPELEKRYKEPGPAAPEPGEEDGGKRNPGGRAKRLGPTLRM